MMAPPISPAARPAPPQPQPPQPQHLASTFVGLAMAAAAMAVAEIVIRILRMVCSRSSCCSLRSDRRIYSPRLDRTGHPFEGRVANSFAMFGAPSLPARAPPGRFLRGGPSAAVNTAIPGRYLAIAAWAAAILAFTASRLKLAPLCIGGNS